MRTLDIDGNRYPMSEAQFKRLVSAKLIQRCSSWECSTAKNIVFHMRGDESNGAEVSRVLSVYRGDAAPAAERREK